MKAPFFSIRRDCRFSRICVVFVASLCLKLGVAPAWAQTTIYVKADATGANNGTSWTDAKTSLQSALSTAQSGDEVWVSSGIYKPSAMTSPPDTRSATFSLLNGVMIYGGFAGTEMSLSERDLGNPTNETLLSGDFAGDDGPGFVNVGDNGYHVVIRSRTNGLAVLDGFPFLGGNADGAGEARNDGGLYNVGGSPSVCHGIFKSNRALVGVHGGAGMYNTAGSPTLDDCRFVGNFSFGNSTGSEMLNIGESSPIVVNCLFEFNGQGGWRGA